MPGINQYAGGLISSVHVVHGDSVALPVRRTAVNTDHGRSCGAASLLYFGQLAVSRGNHDQTSHTVGAQLIEVHALLGGIVIGVAKHEAIGFLVSNIFNAADDLRKKGIGNVRDNDADD